MFWFSNSLHTNKRCLNKQGKKSFFRSGEKSTSEMEEFSYDKIVIFSLLFLGTTVFLGGVVNSNVKEICPRGNNKVIILFPYVMIDVYYSCLNCINWKHNTCVNT